jgi:hypothetical protein
VGETGCLTHDDPDARAAVASRAELLDLAVVEAGGGRATILDEDLGEVTTGAQRRAEDALDHGRVEHDASFLPAGGFSQANCGCVS